MDALREELAAQRDAGQEPYLCMDFEWDSHDPRLPLSLAQLAISGAAPDIIDVKLIDDAGFQIERISGFRALLEGVESPIKVLHDARQDSKVLGNRGVVLGRLFDTQIAHKVLSEVASGDPGKPDNVSLERVVEQYLGIKLPKSRHIKDWHKIRGAWMVRPLPKYVLEYAADDVRHLPALFQKMHALALEQGKLEEIFARSSHRVKPSLPPHIDKAETAMAFMGWLDARPETLARCEDIDIFRQRYVAWKESELRAGRVRSWNATDMIRALSKMDRLSRKAAVLVFHDSESRLTKSARKATLKEAAARVERSRGAIEADKGGLIVRWVGEGFTTESGGCVRRGETAEYKLSLNNTSDRVRVLCGVKLLRKGSTGFSLSPPAPIDGLTLRPGGSHQLTVRCRPMHAGMCLDTISLIFGEFTIGRFLQLRCGDVDLLDDLKPSAPYAKRKRRAHGAPALLPKERIVPAPPRPTEGDSIECRSCRWHLACCS